MPTSRTGRLRRATALVPLALLSAAWTASLAGAGGPVAVAGDRPVPTLPDGTSVPTEAIEAPASVSSGDSIAPGIGSADATQIVSTASTSGIPSAALAAYQRAETVINAADKTCNLTWQLIAAIGRVESNHGRTNGSTLDDQGLATPGIYGIALNGSNNTAEIFDTDAGQYDNDATYDRAVGPMQFIPSTWSVVGVDADGDGVRNPQDVDDAALGTAVYLCSGSDDLGTDDGQRSAVYRYNNSQSYVDLVLSIMEAYTLGDFTTVPNSTVAAGYLVKSPTPITVGSAGDGKGGKDIKAEESTTNEPAAPAQPSAPPAQPAPTTPPPGGGGPGDGGGSGVGGGGNGGGGGPKPSVPPLPSSSVAPVDEALTLAQATAQCIADGIDQVLQPDKFAQCVEDYMNPKTSAQKEAARNVLKSLAAAKP